MGHVFVRNPAAAMNVGEKSNFQSDERAGKIEDFEGLARDRQLMPFVADAERSNTSNRADAASRESGEHRATTDRPSARFGTTLRMSLIHI